jgi:hypothetical protein
MPLIVQSTRKYYYIFHDKNDENDIEDFLEKKRVTDKFETYMKFFESVGFNNLRYDTFDEIEESAIKNDRYCINKFPKNVEKYIKWVEVDSVPDNKKVSGSALNGGVASVSGSALNNSFGVVSFDPFNDQNVKIEKQLVEKVVPLSARTTIHNKKKVSKQPEPQQQEPQQQPDEEPKITKKQENKNSFNEKYHCEVCDKYVQKIAKVRHENGKPHIMNVEKAGQS